MTYDEKILALPEDGCETFAIHQETISMNF